MAKKEVAESDLMQSREEVVDKDAALEQFLGYDQEDWSPDVELVFEPYVDTWRLPRWCRLDEYAYGWLDKSDKDEMFRAFEVSQWRLVKRVNHPGAPDSDFTMMGLVERMGLVLVFRPKWLDDKIRQVPVLKHIERVKQVEADMTKGAVTDERGKTIAVVEPMPSRESDVTMFTEDPVSGAMLEVGEK